MDFIIQAVLQATLVSKLVLVLLLGMSVSSWAYMGAKWLTLRAAQRRASVGLAAFDAAERLEDALLVVSGDEQSPLYGITRRAVGEYNRIARTGDAMRLLSDNVRRSLHFGIAEEIAQLKSSLSLLATTANTAPFIGLFGTVWGIMHSFTAIAQMRSVSLATVAPGIAEALIATAVGLFVAIPAVCGFNVFRAKLNRLEGVCINYAGQLLNRLQHEAEERTGGFSFAEEA